MERNSKGPEAATLNNAIRSRIGRRLRVQYRTFTSGPIPNEHVDLLLALRQVERERLRNMQAGE